MGGGRQCTDKRWVSDGDGWGWGGKQNNNKPFTAGVTVWMKEK